MLLAEEFLVAVGDGHRSIADASAWAFARVQEGHADETMCALAARWTKNSKWDLRSWASDQPWHQRFIAPLACAGTAYCCLLLLPTSPWGLSGPGAKSL